MILDEYCWRTEPTPHTGGWSCPECVQDHLAGFFLALSTWGMAEKLRRLREQGALLRSGICPKCYHPITLMQVGREVWGSPCGHYHWQGRAS